MPNIFMKRGFSSDADAAADADDANADGEE